jgi:hypothetical protein
MGEEWKNMQMEIFMREIMCKILCKEKVSFNTKKVDSIKVLGEVVYSMAKEFFNIKMEDFMWANGNKVYKKV